MPVNLKIVRELILIARNKRLDALNKCKNVSSLTGPVFEKIKKICQKRQFLAKMPIFGSFSLQGADFFCVELSASRRFF